MWGIFEIEFTGNLKLIEEVEGTKKYAEELVDDLIDIHKVQYVIMKIY